jgi:hypothetical protein
MRKRTPSARAAAATTALTLTLAVASAVACDRSSDTAGMAARADSAPDVGFPAIAASAASAASGRPGRSAPSMRPQLEAQRAPMADAAAPAPPSEGAAVGVALDPRANDARGLALGTAATLTGSLAPDPSGAMLIRNGEASVQVTRLDDAVTRLRQTAAQLGGFVANTSIVGGKEEYRTATLQIRVPSGQFDAMVTALGGLGKVESVSATVQDVGDEYVDLRARAANARHMEARLVEMLARRTGKLSEALTVEQELRRVREEVERYDARLNWLERRTALSSLEIALHEPMSVLDQRGPSPIAEAFAEAWRRAVGVVAWCIASLGVLVPLGLVIGGIVAVVRALPRWRRPSAV